MTFIKLTFANDGTKFPLHAETIAFLSPDKENPATTLVWFSGHPEDYIVVQETEDQILKLISDPEFLP